MKILLASLGTAGDIHPFLAIGHELAAAGHAVELLSSPAYAPLAAAAGIAFTPVGRPGDLEATLRHHYTWHPVNGFGVMWRYLARPAMADVYARIERVHREGRCLVLYSPFLMPGARIANEKLGVPALAAYTAATMIPNHYPPLHIADRCVPRGTPRFVCRWLRQMLDRRKMQPLALPAVTAMRAELGLAPLEVSIFGEWIHSPDGGIALFPEWFSPPTPDWPANIVQTGFPLHDADAAAGLEPRLAEFLAAGSAPLVFTAGSAMRGAREFLAAAIDASRALGMRAVLLSADPDTPPAGLGANEHLTGYAPFSLLLPAARAFIHHGGIGSSAQALRAGVRQLVLPQAYDQFDNALALERLGVARVLRRARADAATLGRALRAVLDDASLGAAAAAQTRHFAADRTPERIRALVEAHA